MHQIGADWIKANQLEFDWTDPDWIDDDKI